MKKAYTILYRTIQTADDLHRYKLTMNDYYTSCDILKDLYQTNKPQTTFISAVAAFFKNCGFNVTMDANNINYIISAKEA